MALPQIETGYKPEFGLGAVYQGFNAANADQMSELDIINQFLKNQREQNEQPIDLATKQQTFDINKFKTDPRYQNGMLDQTEGQGLTMLASGQNAKALQPFKLAADRGTLENEAGQNRNQAKIQEIDDILNDPEAKFDPGTQQQLLAARQSLINRFKETPKFAGQRELKETGTDSAEYIAELRAAQAREAARLKAASGGEKPPKSAEEFKQRIHAKIARGEVLSPEEIKAYNLAAGDFDARNEAKRQEGLTINPEATGGALVPKATQAPSPRLDGQQPQATTLEAQVKASGINYEPGTYDYRVVDGKVQRKKKGT